MRKSLQRPLAGLALAGIVILMAVWQGRVAIVREWAARHSLPPPPATTRPAFRTPAEMAADPAVVYAARCEQGLTEQEVVWIATDFIAAGLDREMGSNTWPADAMAYRAAQQRWYLQALGEGFTLSPKQSAQAAARLEALGRQAKDEFSKDQGDRESNREEFVSDLTSTVQWLYGKLDFMPWTLCNLSVRQEKISWKAFLEVQESDASPTNIVNPDFLFPSPDFFGSIPTLEFANQILPLLKTQNLTWVNREVDPLPMRGLIAEMRHFHPAQLKILLLFYPVLAGGILESQENMGTE